MPTRVVAGPALLCLLAACSTPVPPPAPSPPPLVSSMVAHGTDMAWAQLTLALGAPAENPHSSHDMPGMATAEEITSMSAARGEAFDKLFVDSLREHLTQCRNLARSMRQSGQLPDALALAATIESTRQQALTRLAPWPATSVQPSA